MMSFLTGGPPDSLFINEDSSEFISLAYNALSYSMSSAFFKTNAIYIPGECGINNTFTPSTALMKLMFSKVFALVKALVKLFSQVSKF